MRRLVPHAESLGSDPATIAAAVAAEHRHLAGDARPWLIVCMVASVDGAIAVDGRSGPLGPPGDREMFRALRARADAIVVGAGTARTENYGPPTLDAALVGQRRDRGQPDRPTLAIISRSGRLDPAARLFDDGHRPVLIVPESARLDAAVDRACEVIRCGTDDVDLESAMRHLRGQGHLVVVAEGGPRLNADLHAADVIDEWCVTIAPSVVAGPANRLTHGAVALVRPLRLDRMFAMGDALFCRYLVDRVGDQDLHRGAVPGD